MRTPHFLEWVYRTPTFWAYDRQESLAIAKMTARCALYIPIPISYSP